jgi:hypothetical protein
MPDESKDVTLDLKGDNIESVKVKVVYGEGHKKATEAEPTDEEEAYRIKPTGYEMARRHLANCIWCSDKPGYHSDVRYKKLREEAQAEWTDHDWAEYRSSKGDVSPTLMTYSASVRGGSRGVDEKKRKTPEFAGVQTITRRWIIDTMRRTQSGRLVVALCAGDIHIAHPELYIPSIKSVLSEAFLAMVFGDPFSYSYSYTSEPIRSKAFDYSTVRKSRMTVERLEHWIRMRYSYIHNESGGNTT